MGALSGYPEKQPEMVIVGRLVTEAMRRHDWTQEDLAYRSGLSYKTVANMCQGRSDVRVSTLAAVALALGVSVCDLLPADYSILAEAARRKSARIKAGRRARRDAAPPA